MESSKEGQWGNYALAQGSTPYARTLLQSMRAWLEDDPEVARLLGGLDQIRRENLCAAKPDQKAV